MFTLVSILFACIPFDATSTNDINDEVEVDIDENQPSAEPSEEPSVEPSEEPSAEPSEEPLDDFLDLNLEKDPDSDFGRDWMFGWHLVFNGDLLLVQNISPYDEDDNVFQDDYNQFLLEDGQWGFGMTMSPSNVDVYTYMFGGNDYPSYELPLFDSRDRQITLRFVDVSSSIPEGYEGLCPKAVQPRMYYRVFNEGQLCYELELKREISESFFCLNEGTTIDDQNIRQLNQTFQLLAMKQDVIASGSTFKEFKAWMNGHLIVYENPSNWEDVPEECALEESTEPFFILTGLGREIVTDIDTILIPNLNARVDNIILIDPNTIGFNFPSENENVVNLNFWYPNHNTSGTTGTTIYNTPNSNQVMNFSTLPGKDAYAWWNFEWKNEASNEAFSEDFSPRPVNRGIEYEFALESADPNQTDFQASEYYSNQNNHQWSAECWRYADGTGPECTN